MDEQTAKAKLQTLGRLLRKARANAELRQEDVAGRLAEAGLRLSTDGAISKHENGRALIPAPILTACITLYRMADEDAATARALRKELADARDEGALGGSTRPSRFFRGPGSDPGARGGLPLPGVPLSPPSADLQHGAGGRVSGGDERLGPADEPVPAWGVALMQAFAEMQRTLTEIVKRTAAPVLAAIMVTAHVSPADAQMRETLAMASSSCDAVAREMSLIGLWRRLRARLRSLAARHVFHLRLVTYGTPTWAA